MGWKDKERILKKARASKPDGVKFLADLSRHTLGKRQELVPDMIAARKSGKIAYFVLDKPVVPKLGSAAPWGTIKGFWRTSRSF